MDNMVDRFEFGKHEIILEKKFNNHVQSGNPHNIDKYKVGLGNVENIAPIDMPLSTEAKEYADKSAWVIEARETSISGGEFEITLKDNNGKVISRTSINTDSEYAIEDVELDLEHKQLIFHRGAGVADLYCDISELIDAQKSDVTEEKKRAEEAEEELLEAINTESTRAQKKENDLGSAINNVASDLSAEISDRGMADNQLSNNLMVEQNRASNRENELESKITAEANRAQEAENTLTQALSDERDSRKTEDNILLTRLRNVAEYLDDRISDIYLNEGSGEESGVLINKLNEEKYLREQGDSLLTQRINNEVRAAQEREYNLDQKFTRLITEEATRRAADDETLQNSLDVEVQNRQTAVTQVEANLNAEVTRASNTEDALSARLSTVEAKPAMNITSTQINNWDTEVGAKQVISTLANGQVKANKEAIEAINNVDTGILKNAKTYADGLNSAMDTRVSTLESKATNVTKSDTNGNIKVDNEEVQVYNDTALSGRVTTVEGYFTNGKANTAASADNATNADDSAKLNGQDASYYATHANYEDNKNNITALEEIVGDSSTGLVKDVADLKAVGATKVEASTNNGKIKINGNETVVYDETALTSRVTTIEGKETTWDNKQNAITADNKLSADLISDGTTNKAYTAIEKTKLGAVDEGAQANIIEKVQVNGTDLAITDKTVNVVIPAQPEYSIVKDDNSGDSAAIYHLTKDGTNVGVAINIPRDLVVNSGSVITKEGKKYIQLVLNDAAETKIDVEVDSLVDIYTSGPGVTVDETARTISVNESVIASRDWVSSSYMPKVSTKMALFMSKLDTLTTNQIEALIALASTLELSSEE